jgi:hypothetical protein
MFPVLTDSQVIKVYKVSHALVAIQVIGMLSCFLVLLLCIAFAWEIDFLTTLIYFFAAFGLVGWVPFVWAWSHYPGAGDQIVRIGTRGLLKRKNLFFFFVLWGSALIFFGFVCWILEYFGIKV